MRHSAFTLVELMIAILLMAVLSSGVALSFNRTLRRARATDTIEQLRSFDATSRLYAHRYGRTERNVFDIAANTLARREGNKDASYQVSCPSGYWVEEIRVGGQSFHDPDLAAIDISALGLSPSYAVRLRGPGLDQWLLFAGLTGDMTQVSDEATLLSLLDKGTRSANATWAPTPGVNAD